MCSNILINDLDHICTTYYLGHSGPAIIIYIGAAIGGIFVLAATMLIVVAVYRYQRCKKLCPRGKVEKSNEGKVQV